MVTMRSLKTAVVAAAGLTVIVASLLSLGLPKSGAYTFAATNAGCEVKEEGRQSIASFVRGKIAGGTERGDSFDRVVRIRTEAGNYGTGYLIGGNFVLTAGHVADNGEPTVFFTDKSYEGKVLQIDSKADIGLVQIVSDAEGAGPSGIRIGNIRKGDTSIVKTLDTNDVRYRRGSESHKEVQLEIYDGGLLPDANAKREIKTLEKARNTLEAEIYGLEKQEYQLLKPYFDPDGKYSPKKVKATPFRWNSDSRNEKSEDYYSYLGKTKNDAFIPGMSGSAIFNQSGELVGVAINTLKLSAVHGGGSDSGRGYISGVPESVMQRTEELSDKRDALTNRIREVESRIYQLENPPTPTTYSTYSGVSPKAIVSFLQDACAAKPIK